MAVVSSALLLVDAMVEENAAMEVAVDNVVMNDFLLDMTIFIFSFGVLDFLFIVIISWTSSSVCLYGDFKALRH